MIGLHPIIAFATEMAIKRSKQDFGILNKGGVRTNKEQATLYAQGRTSEGNKVTWTLNSRHQKGQAVDLVAYNKGKYNWKVKNYKEIIKAMKSVIKEYKLPIDHAFEVGLKGDYPHWQMRNSNYDIRKIAPNLKIK